MGSGQLVLQMIIGWEWEEVACGGYLCWLGKTGDERVGCLTGEKDLNSNKRECVEQTLVGKVGD